MRAFVSLLLLLLSTAACTSSTVVQPPVAEKDLRSGDRIVVLMRDGRELDLIVTAITPVLHARDSTGAAQQFAWRDVTLLKVTRPAPARTAAAVAGAAAFVYVLVGLTLLLGTSFLI